MQNEIFSETKSGIEFSVHLVPGAKTEKIIGVIETERGKAIKIAIHAKPTENKANLALIRFLAEVLNISKSQISIKRGHKSKEKRMEVHNISISYILKSMLFCP